MFCLHVVLIWVLFFSHSHVAHTLMLSADVNLHLLFLWLCGESSSRWFHSSFTVPVSAPALSDMKVGDHCVLQRSHLRGKLQPWHCNLLLTDWKHGGVIFITALLSPSVTVSTVQTVTVCNSVCCMYACSQHHSKTCAGLQHSEVWISFWISFQTWTQLQKITHRHSWGITCDLELTSHV